MLGHWRGQIFLYSLSKSVCLSIYIWVKTLNHRHDNYAWHRPIATNTLPTFGTIDQKHIREKSDIPWIDPKAGPTFFTTNLELKNWNMINSIPLEKLWKLIRASDFVIYIIINYILCWKIRVLYFYVAKKMLCFKLQQLENSSDVDWKL